MSTQDDRRQYYRIEDQVPMRLTALENCTQAPDLQQLENEMPSSFVLINTLHEIESEASVSLASIQGNNPAIVEYLRTLNKRLDLIGGYIAEQEFKKAKNSESTSLSGNGFRLNHNQPFAIDTIMLIEMLLPYKRTGIHCYGRVVECVQEADKFSIAVMYETIREADREAIIRHVIRQESKLIRQTKELDSTPTKGKRLKEKMMKSLLPTAIFATLLGFSNLTLATAAEQSGELHTTAVTTQGDDSVTRPRNSQTMEEVIAEFGVPDKKLDAIGEPPITRWEYAKYNVFFENNQVIHTVLKQ